MTTETTRATDGQVNPQMAGALLELHCGTINQLTGDDEKEHYAVGRAWAQIVDHRLAELSGYRSSREFFQARIKAVPQSSLTRYAAVARAFAEPIALRYGTTRLNLLLSLRNVLRVEGLPDDPGPFEVPVPDASGAVCPKPFAQCSAGELSRALRALKAPAQALPPEQQARVEALQAVLDRVLGEDSPAKVKARVRGVEVLLELEGLPLDQIVEVGRGLAGEG